MTAPRIAVVTGGSSGIGLAVSDEIVNMHGGELNIESKVGEGTCVYVVLPLLKQADDAELDRAAGKDEE